MIDGGIDGYPVPYALDNAGGHPGMAVHFAANGGRCTLEKASNGAKAHLLSEGDLQCGPFGHGKFTVRHRQHLIVLRCCNQN